MLQQLLHIIIVSIVCIVWGLPFYFLFYRNKQVTGEYGSHFEKLIFLFFSGLLTLSLLSSWFVLIVPLRIEFLLCATGALLLAFTPLLSRHNMFRKISGLYVRNRTTLLLIPFALVTLLLFLVLGTLTPSNPDTYIYHLQIVRWTNEYGVVPGVANLYPRFGLGSNWFNLISAFYIPQFNHQNFTYLNTSVVVWFFAWLLNKWAFHYNRRDHGSLHPVFSAFYFILIAYCLFDWQLLRDSANSTSYDFIVTSLTLICICYIAENIFFERPLRYSTFFILAALSTIPFKLSGIFIVFLVIPYLISLRSWKAWFHTAIIGLLVLIPFLLKNYITTGYPLFPSALSIGSPDWQLPRELASGLGDYIMNVNKYYNYQVSFVKEQEVTAFNWIPYWMNSILLRHKIVLGFSLLSIYLFFYNPVGTIRHRAIRIFVLSLWAMMAGWFFTAPDPRFGFSFILFLAIFPLCLLLGRYVRQELYLVAFVAAIIPIAIYLVNKAKPIYRNSSLQWHTLHIENPPARQIMVNDVPFYFTRMDTIRWLYPCAFGQLPCAGENNPYVRPRGKTIEHGFYMAPISDTIFIRNYNY